MDELSVMSVRSLLNPYFLFSLVDKNEKELLESVFTAISSAVNDDKQSL